MRLLEFASLIKPLHADGHGALTRELTGVAWDARRAAPGNLFVAIPGPGRDTQAAIDLAIERGAVAVLCEGREVVSLRVTRLQVANVRSVLGRVAELFFGQPDRRLKIVGVVGGFGTSAPAALLKSVLDAAGFKPAVIGSTGCEIGERQLPPPRRNCEALDYHELLAQVVRAGCGACVIEISPHAIEQKLFVDIAFDVVIFGSFEALTRLAGPLQFCRTLASGPKRFTAAFNVDDSISRALYESGACAQRISFGFNAAANVRGSDVEVAHRSLGMLVTAGAQEIRLRTKLTGRQNALHLLAASAGAMAVRVPLQLLRFTLQKAPPPIGSMEPLPAVDDLPVYVDEARSITEVARAIESLREITGGRVLLALASTGGETLEQRIQLGRMASGAADYTVITTNNPRGEAAIQIAAQIERGFHSGAHKPYHIQLDRAQAIYDLIEMAGPRDAVLITGKGHETHQEFADTIVPFDDREHALAALEMRRSPPRPIVLTRTEEPTLPPVMAAIA